MEQNGQLTCHRNDGLVLGLLAARFRKVQTPRSERRVSTMRPEDVVRALDQQTSEICVARLRDAKLRVSFTGLAAAWSQPQITANIASSPKAFLVAQGENER